MKSPSERPTRHPDSKAPIARPRTMRGRLSVPAQTPGLDVSRATPRCRRAKLALFCMAHPPPLRGVGHVRHPARTTHWPCSAQSALSHLVGCAVHTIRPTGQIGFVFRRGILRVFSPNPLSEQQIVGWREHQLLVAEGHYRCPDCCRPDTMKKNATHAPPVVSSCENTGPRSSGFRSKTERGG